jgi:hypothetical protein
MNRFAKAALAGTALLAATAGVAFAVGPGHGYGPCGAAFEDGIGAGPMGRMGRHGGWGGGPAIDRQLTADDARAIVAGRLAMSGNKRLKVGEVKEKDAATVTAEIVTVDNSLVRRVEIDRKTGRFTPVQ